jgi:peptide/nickel transport system substrate-binding protein
LLGLVLACVTACGGAAGARASEITIGLAAAPTSADPHFHQVTPNNMLANHIFDLLLTTNAKLQFVPDLAESWTLENGRTWCMALRQDVVFHDGTKFTSTDVFALMRAQGLTRRTTYGVFGHSAGGQFVHRMISLGLRSRVAAAVTANAGT